MTNQQIAERLTRYADLLEITGANPFRIGAYRTAARSIADCSLALAQVTDKQAELRALAGIGQDLAAKIETLVQTGSFSDYDKLQSTIPGALLELLELPGLGPKRVKALFDHLGIDSLPALKDAATAGKLRSIPGMGKKIEQNILQEIERWAKQPRRFLRSQVKDQADSIGDRFRTVDPDVHLAIAGSYRRGRDTIGDLDLLASAQEPDILAGALVELAPADSVLVQGPTKTSVRMADGLQVDLRIVDPQCFGAALHYFTGSQAHNMALRREARKRGLRINEYGVFNGEDRLGGASEEEIFAAVDLPWIPPELREDRGEFEAAREGRLPHLVTLSDLHGDLHSHTTDSDGRNSLEEMASAARSAGFSYLAVTDHSRSLAVANGLDEDRLLRQMDRIDALNATLDGFTILRGIEVDILEDGRLDLPDRVLSKLDLVICSVHTKFELSRDAQTERILRAMDRPFFSVLAHPTGRRLVRRNPYDVDMARIIEYARRRGCFLECNANPKRLDLHDVHCRMAKDAGVLISIATDSHGVTGFRNAEYGVSQARRGWLTPSDVLNTRSLNDLRTLLKQTMRG